MASQKMAKQPLSSRANGARDLGEAVVVESSIFWLNQNRQSGRERILSPRDSLFSLRPPEITPIAFRRRRNRFAVGSTSQWKSRLVSQYAGSAWEVGQPSMIFGLIFRVSWDSRTHKNPQPFILTTALK